MRKIPFRRISYDNWAARFKPQKNTVHNKDNPIEMFETFGEELDAVLKMNDDNPHRVWTLVDCGLKYLRITPGYHYVNRIGYFITEEPWVPGLYEDELEVIDN